MNLSKPEGPSSSCQGEHREGELLLVRAEAEALQRGTEQQRLHAFHVAVRRRVMEGAVAAAGTLGGEPPLIRAQLIELLPAAFEAELEGRVRDAEERLREEVR